MKGSMIGAVAGGAVAATAIFSLGAWSGSRSAAPVAEVAPQATPAQQQVMTATPTPAAQPVVAAVPVINLAPRYADILNVTAVKRRNDIPREICTQQTVVHQVPAQDADRATGKLLGAVIGGVVGHQFGGGKGKDAATVGGAILGGMIGNNVQKQQQAARTYTTQETQCSTVVEQQEKIIGYDVTYRLDGRSEVIRLGYQPEPRVPVENNQIVFLPYGGAAMTPVKVALSY